MRLAISHPFWVDGDQDRNFNGYDFEFLRQFKPVIYVNGFKKWLTRGLRYRKALQRAGLASDEYDFAFSERELNRKADVVLCFNGFPYRPNNAPPRGFNGMKVWHMMDYVYRASESNRILESAGVDYVMGYTNHGKYCDFFRKFYPSYVDRVIPVPFGFGRRFVDRTPFNERCQKVIALGSVRPVDDPSAPDRETLRDYREHYNGVKWTHQWRRMLAEHHTDLSDIMDSQLPIFPLTENPSYDAVSMLNKYSMFANDEGLMAFPPARTYEGAASGCVLVCSDHASYSDLGFQDGVNCIMHKSCDIRDFREKVQYYLRKPSLLARIQSEGTKMVRTAYSHKQVAMSLLEMIRERFSSCKKVAVAV